MKDAPEVYITSRSEWREWLAHHFDTVASAWLVYDKGKARTVMYDEMVEEALCFGWVDSIQRTVDDARAKLYFSRRKPKSAWSKINKERIERLSSAQLMMPAGIAAVEVAKQNGAWDALNRSDAYELPTEMIALLDTHPKAKAFYESMPPSSHKIILEWIYAAKRDETRLARIHETIELADQGVKAHHYRQ